MRKWVEASALASSGDVIFRRPIDDDTGALLAVMVCGVELLFPCARVCGVCSLSISAFPGPGVRCSAIVMVVDIYGGVWSACASSTSCCAGIGRWACWSRSVGTRWLLGPSSSGGTGMRHKGGGRRAASSPLCVSAEVASGVELIVGRNAIDGSTFSACIDGAY